MRKFKVFILLAIVSPSSFAYIDPGSGAMMIQAFMAAIVAVIFYFRNPKQLAQLLLMKLKKWFKKTP